MKMRHKTTPHSTFETKFKFREIRQRVKLLSDENLSGKSIRMYHTNNKYNAPVHCECVLPKKTSKIADKYKEYLTRDRKIKTAMSIKALNLLKRKTQNNKETTSKPPWELKFERTHYKVLNASAKQKYRSFNVQKKILPSGPMMILMDRRKKDKSEKESGLTVREESEKCKGKTEEVENVVEEERKTEVTAEEPKKKDLVAKREPDRTAIEPEDYRDFIFRQLQDLKKENEELKVKVLKIMENKKLENSLQLQSDSLELEKTKLKACWLVMMSTLDAFSNFCRKFTSKSDSSLIKIMKKRRDAARDFEDPFDCAGNLKKEQTYNRKYYNFLKELMQDEEEGEKAYSRVEK